MQRRIRIRSRARAAISRVLHKKAISPRLRRVEGQQVRKAEAQRLVVRARAQKAPARVLVVALVLVQEHRRRLHRRLHRVQVVRDAAAPGGPEAAGGLAEAGDTAAAAEDRDADLEVRVDVLAEADRVGRTSVAREIM
jgi:hypothetical protein